MIGIPRSGFRSLRLLRKPRNVYKSYSSPDEATLLALGHAQLLGTPRRYLSLIRKRTVDWLVKEKKVDPNVVDEMLNSFPMQNPSINDVKMLGDAGLQQLIDAVKREQRVIADSVHIRINVLSHDASAPVHIVARGGDSIFILESDCFFTSTCNCPHVLLNFHHSNKVFHCFLCSSDANGIWDLDTGDFVPVNVRAMVPSSVSLSFNDELLAVGFHSGCVLYDTNTGLQVSATQCPPCRRWSTCLAFVPSSVILM